MLNGNSSNNRHKSIVTTHLILNSFNKTLLTLRKNTGYADGLYSVITGGVDAGETIIEATIREAWEEVGVIVCEADLKFCCVLHRRGEVGYDNFFFVANSWRGDARNCEPDKCQEVGFHYKAIFPPNVLPYVKQAFKCLERGIYFEEITSQM